VAREGKVVSRAALSKQLMLAEQMSAKAFVFVRFLADFGEVTASPCCVSPANSKAVGTLFLLGIMRVASNGIGRNSRRFLCETAVGSGTASTPIVAGLPLRI
jgi:hypothetical protein